MVDKRFMGSLNTSDTVSYDIPSVTRAIQLIFSLVDILFLSSNINRNCVLTNDNKGDRLLFLLFYR